jgi:hypothetical protein
MPKLVIYEWDGDRSSAVGGFKLELHTVAGVFNLDDGTSYSYDTHSEREAALKKLELLAESIGLSLRIPVAVRLSLVVGPKPKVTSKK